MNPGSGEDCSRFWISRACVPDFESGLGVFAINYCTKCKIGLTDPYPSEETSGYLYKEKSSGDFDVIRPGWIDRLKDHLSRRLLRKIAQGSPGEIRHVLDYSCGNARFAAAAETLFPRAEVHAVDYQERMPFLLVSGGHPRLSYFNVNAFAGMDQTYDLIILRHVLEHTHDPIRLVSLLASRLAPTGVLYIEVPNLDAGCARIFKNKWKGYYVPRHLFHYTADSLHHIITAAGLKGRIERNEMPLMGNTISILFGVKKESRIVQALGILLHPVQLAIEAIYSSSTCLNVKARRSAPVNR